MGPEGAHAWLSGEAGAALALVEWARSTPVVAGPRCLWVESQEGRGHYLVDLEEEILHPPRLDLGKTCPCKHLLAVVAPVAGRAGQGGRRPGWERPWPEGGGRRPRGQTPGPFPLRRCPMSLRGKACGFGDGGSAEGGKASPWMGPEVHEVLRLRRRGGCAGS